MQNLESRAFQISFPRFHGSEGKFESMQSKAADISELPLKEDGPEPVCYIGTCLSPRKRKTWSQIMQIQK